MIIKCMHVYYLIYSFILLVNLEMMPFYLQTLTQVIQESYYLKIIFSVIKWSYLHMYVVHNHIFCYTVCTHYLCILCMSFTNYIISYLIFLSNRLYSILYYFICSYTYIIMKFNQTLNFMYIIHISSHQTTAKIHIKQQFGIW